LHTSRKQKITTGKDSINTRKGLQRLSLKQIQNKAFE